jgi:transcription elongation factor Elf1
MTRLHLCDDRCTCPKCEREHLERTSEERMRNYSFIQCPKCGHREYGPLTERQARLAEHYRGHLDKPEQVH